MAAAVTTKVVLDGTHRTRAPEATWEWIRPRLSRMGITRVADVTWLDDIGIPVFQAVRPNALTLSVSQGKGLTPALARVSAAMESVELWHAEHPLPVAASEVSAERMEPVVGYAVEDLVLAPRHRLTPDTRLRWRRAQRVDGVGESFLPMELLRLDARVTPRWDPPLFRATSNGLASGNTLAEALLHGMYEVIERDTMTRAAHGSQLQPVALESIVDAGPALLLERFRAAGVEVEVAFAHSAFPVPTFTAQIWSEAFPRAFTGSGTHLDSAVALSRALTEAAQSRATAIAGARDDIGKSVYRQATSDGTRRSSRIGPRRDGRARVPFDSIDFLRLLDTDSELTHVARVIHGVTGHPPLYVDLTRPEIGIPVAHVVCPGAVFDVRH
ncbi:hypothetical protein ALI144C_06580 [Actinosynnema sp. ALI-1.44]|nr:hypothetical protein ALI144C_06580 [Actinosynnema sp. ALI-1.44]